jgi:hypothetical protein
MLFSGDCKKTCRYNLPPDQGKRQATIPGRFVRLFVMSRDGNGLTAEELSEAAADIYDFNNMNTEE